MTLFDVKPLDMEIYRQELMGFLPSRIIDIHAHIWLKSLMTAPGSDYIKRQVSWPSKVAEDNSVEDLVETYRLMFPGKTVTPMMFASVTLYKNIADLNAYVAESARRFGFPALFYAHPGMTADELERGIRSGGFLGVKSYLNLAPEYLPEAEIRIYDFFPKHHLEVVDRLGMIVMLHIPRNDRLKDPVNIAQILEIRRNYPNLQLIVAHVGRAYCESDVGDALEKLGVAEGILFDFSANCNRHVFEWLIRAVGPKRILFGSDLPILRMRTRRIDENGRYVNLVPPGLYGDVSNDSHLRETSAEDAESITFFMYEEILAMKAAAARCGLLADDIEDMFHNNAARVIAAAKTGV